MMHATGFFYATCRHCGLTKFSKDIDATGRPASWPRPDLCPDCKMWTGPHWPAIWSAVALGVLFGLVALASCEPALAAQ